MRDGIFHHYEGMASFAAGCRRRRFTESNSSWAGGTRAQALDWAVKGDTSHVEEAERLVDGILADVDVDRWAPRWCADVAGAFPCVPAYCAGVPETMIARHEVPSPSGEVEIWANTTVSAKCDQSDMMRRGVVTLALAISLSRLRPVSIVLYSTVDGSNVAIRLSQPFDVSEACAAFCQPAVTRQLVYGHADQDGFNGGWAYWASVERGPEMEFRALVECAGMPEDAIHLPTERLGEYASVSDGELVRILNEKVAEVMSRGEA